MPAAALAQVPVFVAVAERRSFTAGARALGMSPSAASQAVARLEQALGAALLLRTTRSVSLTDAGSRLLAEAAPALATAFAALEAVRGARDAPSGVLRLNVPRVTCRVALPRLLAEFARRYPAVRCEVVVDDRRVDIVDAGFDAGIRLKEAIQKDMIRVRLTPPLRMAVVGSKRYLAARGRPRHPRELVAHACLGWRLPSGDGEYRWEFSERGRSIEVAVSGPVFTNDVDFLIACAEQDLGLAFVAEPEVSRDIAAGCLEEVLHEYSAELAGLFLYFPRAARDVPKLRAFVACAKDVAAASPARSSGAKP
jgi:DNA-binding transcriptional LysR family regulator